MNWKLFLTVAIVFGLLIRVQNFHLLPIDGHAMRQTDTESVAYNFAFRNRNILYPQNSLIRPITNTNSYFFLEFPAYQYLISILYRLFGWQIELARILNLFLYTISALSLFIFIKKLFRSSKIAFFSSFFFIFAPGSIFFLGHAIHPDIFAISMYLISLTAYLYWKEGRRPRWLILSLITLSLSVATRPFMLIGLPAYLFLMRIKGSAYWEYFIYIFFSPLIYGFWKNWQFQFKAADSSWENWILDGRKSLFTYEIFVKRLLLKNVIGEVMGKTMSFFAGLGFVNFFLKRDKPILFVLIWLLLVPVYWLIVPNGNIIHQYYSDIFLIPVAILAGYGLTHLTNYILQKNKLFGYFTIIIILLFTIYNGYRTSRYYFHDLIPENQLQIAKEIDRVIPKDSKIVYLANNNSVLFSLYHRRGWMLGTYPVDVEPTAKGVLSMKQYGAEYIVAGKNNTDLSEEELGLIKKKAILQYSSEWVEVFRIIN
ncbi:MAG: hypothetical protein WC741_04130 [Patescibacteria group bacterium]|jgi:hypothetical protein